MKIKQIATINAGYPFRGKIPEVAGSSVLVVQMKDISIAEGVLWSGCLETELTGKRAPDYLVAGDILIVARGNHYYATQVDQKLTTTGKKAVAAPHFFVVRLKRQDILPEFITWMLNQAPAQRHLEQNAEGTLTKSIRRNVLEDVSIVIPSLAKQQIIIAIANTLREERRLLQQLINNGEDMMSAIANDLYSASD